jgi:enoyl-[acyl-carrier-protein] reductase (NADH)
MNTVEQMVLAPYFSPISRVGTPIDVAKVVYFLASEEAGFISGENITIDGGYNIMSVLLKSEADPELSTLLQTYIKGKNK